MQLLRLMLVMLVRGRLRRRCGADQHHRSLVWTQDREGLVVLSWFERISRSSAWLSSRTREECASTEAHENETAFCGDPQLHVIFRPRPPPALALVLPL